MLSFVYGVTRYLGYRINYREVPVTSSTAEESQQKPVIDLDRERHPSENQAPLIRMIIMEALLLRYLDPELLFPRNLKSDPVRHF